MNVYIRPLRENDALTSYKWRNDPDVWKYTGKKPDRYITEEIELSWIRGVLKNETSKRFAICISGTDEYIGNAQLTDINSNTAQYHIFIGDKKYWGKGLSSAATKLVLDYAFYKLNIKMVYSEFNIENKASIRMCEKNGFKIVASTPHNIRMEVYSRG